MALPCMRSAKLLAGERGLDNIVTAVSVLEYPGRVEIQEKLFQTHGYLGSEFIITAFSSIGEDVDKQCEEIQTMYSTGSVGMVLYYMDLFVKRLDSRVLKLADELGFVIVCMPPDQFHLRYSETISGIQNAIFEDQNKTANFAPDILDTLASLPKSRQNMGTLLRILSDYLHLTLILTDSSWQLISYAAWPMMLERNIHEIIGKATASFGAYGEQEDENGADYKLLRIENASLNQRNLIVTGPPGVLTEEMSRQITTVVQVFWKMSAEKDSGDQNTFEFIRAVICDEPIKMRRLARSLGIDETKLDNILLFRPNHPNAADERRAVEIIREELAHYCRNLVVDLYSGDVVVLLDNGISPQWIPSLGELVRILDSQRINGLVFYACDLETMANLRDAYHTAIDTMHLALKLYPRSRLLSLHEILFAKSCSDSIQQGEGNVRDKLRILRCMDCSDAKQEKELQDTLAVFYFDAHMKTSETAELMYLHQNTVNYRLRKISEKLGCRVTDMPEMLELYTALAFRRLLNE